MPKGGNHGVRASTWWGSNTPATGPVGTSTTWVGIRFSVDTSGKLAGMSFWDGFAAAQGYSLGVVFQENNPPRDFFAGRGFDIAGVASSPRWRNIWFKPFKHLDAGDVFWCFALYVGGGFFRTNNILGGAGITRGHINSVGSAQSTALDLSLATITINANANAIDVLFYPD